MHSDKNDKQKTCQNRGGNRLVPSRFGRRKRRDEEDFGKEMRVAQRVMGRTKKSDWVRVWGANVNAYSD